LSGLEVGLGSIVALLVLVYAGMHVSTVMMLVSFAGTWMLREDAFKAAQLLGIAASDAISDYEFGVIPLFVLMGLAVMTAGLGRDSYQVAHRLLRRVPGGLGHATVGGNALFAAVTGVSVASAVVFTRLAVPEMVRYGYDRRFAVGVVAGSSVLGMLIPPSVLMIIFGLLTQTSIGDLFIAGVLPGLLLAAAYSALILAWAKRAPWKFGRNAAAPERLGGVAVAAKLAPIVLLVAAVLGGIYAGAFTATEAGAVGATLGLAVAFARGALDRSSFWRLLVETGHVTASLLVLIIAANMYTRFLAVTGLPSAAAGWMGGANLGLWSLVAIYLCAILLLGTLMDSASILLITVPLVLPLFIALGVNLVWIGVVTVVAVEVGLLTPPFGMAAFVIKSVLEDQSISLHDIFAGAFPFACVMVLVVIAVLAFPWLATGLLRAPAG
jgi:tripartite ATP-independent transporter DctM subunit